MASSSSPPRETPTAAAAANTTATIPSTFVIKEDPSTSNGNHAVDDRDIDARSRSSKRPRRSHHHHHHPSSSPSQQHHYHQHHQHHHSSSNGGGGGYGDYYDYYQYPNESAYDDEYYRHQQHASRYMDDHHSSSSSHDHRHHGRPAEVEPSSSSSYYRRPASRRSSSSAVSDAYHYRHHNQYTNDDHGVEDAAAAVADHDSSRRSSSSSRHRSKHRQQQQQQRSSRSTSEQPTAAETSTSSTNDQVEEQRKQRCTVFVHNLAERVDERILAEFLRSQQMGFTVTDVKIIKDKRTGLSRGFAYVEFASEEEARAVVERCSSSGGSKEAAMVLEGLALVVKPMATTADVDSTGSGSHHRNDIATAAGTVNSRDLDGVAAAAAGDGDDEASSINLSKTSREIVRLYFRPTPDVFDERDFRYLFESLGRVVRVEIAKDAESEERKGYGYVTYRHSADAIKALTKLHHSELGNGVVLRLGVWNEARAREFDESWQMQQMQMLQQQQQEQQAFAAAAAAGMWPAATVAPSSTDVAQLPIALPSSVAPTHCLLLTNMFDPTTETDPNFDADIKEDVAGEAAKFGTLLHIHVDKYSMGNVYLRFDTVESAQRAYQVMHLRWFGQKQILASFVPDEAYTNQFGRSGQQQSQQQQQ